MQSQDAQVNATLLKDPHTAQKMTNKAIKNFINVCGCDAKKAEKRWNEEAKADGTWAKFKTFWKSGIHDWNVCTTETANVGMSRMRCGSCATPWWCHSAISLPFRQRIRVITHGWHCKAFNFDKRNLRTQTAGSQAVMASANSPKLFCPWSGALMPSWTLWAPLPLQLMRLVPPGV